MKLLFYSNVYIIHLSAIGRFKFRRFLLELCHYYLQRTVPGTFRFTAKINYYGFVHDRWESGLISLYLVSTNYKFFETDASCVSPCDGF